MKQADITKRIDLLERLLDGEHSVHPAGCRCAIMSRDIAHHDSKCPYRLLKELLPELRALRTSGE